MKPHELCKKAGLKSLAQVSEMTKVSIQTLNNWSKTKPLLFGIVILGCKKKKEIGAKEGTKPEQQTTAKGSNPQAD